MEAMTEITTSAEAAAAWWAEKLAGPVHQDNGGGDLASTFAGALASGLAERNPVTSEQLETFQAALVQRIRARQSEHPSGYCGLGVDYGPDLDLGAAADEAGISTSRFPWKTNCWVYPDRFVVSNGYGGRETLAWAEQGYEPPPCGARNYTLDFDPLPEVCGLPLYHQSDHSDWQPSPVPARGY